MDCIRFCNAHGISKAIVNHHYNNSKAAIMDPEMLTGNVLLDYASTV